MNHRLKHMVLGALAVLALAGCSEGGQGKSGGPVATPRIDAFTSAVVTLARDTPEDAAPADIESIPVVLVDDQPAVTIN